MYKAYDSLRPIHVEDYYHAISEANRAASVGVKKVKTDDYFVDWFKDQDADRRAEDKARMDAAILRLEIAKQVAQENAKGKETSVKNK